VVKDFTWSAEKLSELDKAKLEIVLANAKRAEKIDLVSLCEEEFSRRTPPKKPRLSSQRNDGPVMGFHFVCKRDQGVSQNADGTFWTGTWVVAKERAEDGEKNCAYVALHEKKSEPSYLQGTIRGWRIASRDRQYGEVPIQTDEGIDFLIEPTSVTLGWQGDGTGEKGYWYGDDKLGDTFTSRRGDAMLSDR
jgi:hypothetical protein